MPFHALQMVTIELLTVAVILLAIAAAEIFYDANRRGKWPWQ